MDLRNIKCNDEDSKNSSKELENERNVLKSFNWMMNLKNKQIFSFLIFFKVKITYKYVVIKY